MNTLSSLGFFCLFLKCECLLLPIASCESVYLSEAPKHDGTEKPWSGRYTYDLIDNGFDSVQNLIMFGFQLLSKCK